MQNDKNKKNIKLITRQHVVIMTLAVCIGVGLYIYREVAAKGFLDTTAVISAILSLIIVGGVIFIMTWWANKP